MTKTTPDEPNPAAARHSAATSYPTFSIRALVDSLPGDIDELADIAREEGHAHLKRLVEEHRSGANRFDREGEVLLHAIDLENRTIGVAGLNQDPYVARDPRVGRIRRMFVAPVWRRQGVARALLNEIELHAGAYFSKLQLYTSSAEAGRFYASMGFREVSSNPTNPQTDNVIVKQKVSHKKIIE